MNHAVFRSALETMLFALSIFVQKQVQIPVVYMDIGYYESIWRQISAFDTFNVFFPTPY